MNVCDPFARVVGEQHQFVIVQLIQERLHPSYMLVKILADQLFDLSRRDNMIQTRGHPFDECIFGNVTAKQRVQQIKIERAHDLVG